MTIKPWLVKKYHYLCIAIDKEPVKVTVYCGMEQW